MSATRQARGGFGGGAPGAAGRGVVLIAVAVVIGLLLLWQGLDESDGTIEATDGGAAVDGGSDGTVTDGGTDGTATDGTVTDGGTDGTATDGGTDGTVTDAGTDDTTGVTTDTTPLTTRAPNEVSVLVANGSGQSGAAGTVTDKLKQQNFNTLDAANADPTETSKVYYRPGFDQDAQAVARVVGATPDLVLPVPDPSGVAANAADRAEQANVIVIIGSDGRIPVT